MGDRIKQLQRLQLIQKTGNGQQLMIQGGGSKIAESITDTSFVYYDSTNWGYQFSLFSYDGAVIDQNNIKIFWDNRWLDKI